MRCRKARSYLSAYCNNELSDKQRQAVAMHLKDCPECRREEALSREIKLSASRLTVGQSVSSDFNEKLLNRIAGERFKETRTKAYMPKNAPIFGWGRLAPAMATAALLVVFAFSGGIGLIAPQQGPAVIADNSTVGDQLDDRYINAQPVEGDVRNRKINNNAYAQHVSADWTFRRELARATRIRNVMSQLASGSNFGSATNQMNYNNFIPGGRTLVMRLPIGQSPVNSNLIKSTSNSQEAIR